jgi:dihydrofolate reductase
MRRLIASEWITLDGVFDADTMSQWFEPYESHDRANYIRETVLAAGELLLGRTTYEMLAAHWSTKTNNEDGIADKLNAMPKHVAASATPQIVWNNSNVVSHNLEEAVTRLKQQPGKDLLIFGSGTLVRSLVKAGLVDEFRFLVHPVMSGAGKRFFDQDTTLQKLKLVNSAAFGRGVLLLCYQPVRT